MPVTGHAPTQPKRRRGPHRLIAALAVTAVFSAACAHAQDREAAAPVAVQPVATYADFARLAELASIVALVEVRDQAVVRPERAPGLAPGHARLYVTAQTVALLASRSPIGESLNYLVDVPLDAKGRPPRLRKQRFLETATGEPVSLTIVRRPGMDPQWGVSWSEIVDQSARPPEPETVEWYRLACSLPPQLPAGAYLQDDRESRVRAEADYRFVLEQLGPCERLRT